MRHLVLVVPLVVACGAKPGGPRACPSANGPHCFLFSPLDTGLTGQGATVDHIAVRPAELPRGQLLLFLNGSGGTPQAGASFYASARDEGLHVVGLSYRSGDAVGAMCRGDDACFEPTRVSQLTGVLQPGAAGKLSDLVADEGIEPRLVAALKLLVTLDADGNWGQFLDGEAVRWPLVLVSGHSQGGGHAALLAKRHPVDRALMLASPCDAKADGSPASWLSDSSGWATDARTRLFGLWAQGDETCPAAPVIWERLGMPASARDTTASTCTGAGAHGAPIACSSNAERWRAVLR